MKISDQIKQIRQRLCLTQAELADIIGKKRSVVGHYESGLVMPPADVWEKIKALEAPEGAERKISE